MTVNSGFDMAKTRAAQKAQREADDVIATDKAEKVAVEAADRKKFEEEMDQRR